MSSHWNDWRTDVFGSAYLVWHEGPDFTRLLELGDTQPADVERMLDVGVAEQDWLAAQSLGELHKAGLAPSNALALLRSAAPTSSGKFRTRVAQSIHVLTGDESTAELILTVLATGAHWNERYDAAISLTDYTPTSTLIAALGHAVTDVEYLVRYHASNTLLRYAGRPDSIADIPLFELVASPREGEASEADRNRWLAAADQLTADATRALD